MGFSAMMRTMRSRCLWGVMLVPLLAATGCVSLWPRDVEMALSQAGENRPELERVLLHYRDAGDEQKLDAAEFLIANMPGHGYTVAALYDKERNEIPFDALEYKTFKEGLAALEALEAEHGELGFKRKRFDDDLEMITAAFLIENIDLAFQAWREKPWARDLTYEAFREHILPYRGSNEPLHPWRAACMERYAKIAEQVEDPNDAHKVGRKLQKDVDGWIRFHDLYYLHPTDQGYIEMCTRKKGRCEDITNMQMYALRANAVAAASDYTPAWADRDNNHAWQVILDEQGRGKAGLFHTAAKIYRKMFARQPDSLGMIKRDDEQVPPWLGGKNFIDVTSQYLDTVDVTVKLTNETPEGARFAYVCVFNGGEWVAIHWAKIEGGQATFTDLGPKVVYLPAYYVDKELVPAAAPFVVSKEGEVRRLTGDTDATLAVDLAETRPGMVDQDTREQRPRIAVEPGKTYELFYWDDGWQSLGKRAAGGEPVSFDNLPANRLYWLVAEGSRRLERIFTIDAGEQIFW